MSLWTAWWRHQMETFSALLALCAGNSPVSGEFPAQRPVARSFDVFFDLRLNKRLSKQSWGWWFETHCAHCDVTIMCNIRITPFCCHVFILQIASLHQSHSNYNLTIKFCCSTAKYNWKWYCVIHNNENDKWMTLQTPLAMGCWLWVLRRTFTMS